MITLTCFLSLYVLWVFYLAVMNLKRARDAGTLTRNALYLGYPVLLIGYGIDVLVNLTVCTILFLEIPKEWTVTGRLKRHLYHSEPGSWREVIAAWFCANLLNSFDPDGRHC